MAEKFLSLAETAVVLGVSERTVRKRIQRGEIPAEKGTTDRGWAWKIPAEAVKGSEGGGGGRGSAEPLPSPVLDRLAQQEEAWAGAGPPTLAAWAAAPAQLQEEIRALREEVEGKEQAGPRRAEGPPEGEVPGGDSLERDLGHPQLQGYEPYGLVFQDGKAAEGEIAEISSSHVLVRGREKVLLVRKPAIRGYLLKRPEGALSKGWGK